MKGVGGSIDLTGEEEGAIVSSEGLSGSSEALEVFRRRKDGTRDAREGLGTGGDARCGFVVWEVLGLGGDVGVGRELLGVLKGGGVAA